MLELYQKGCIQHARTEEAMKYFQLMLLKGTSPNAVTFICALKACGSLGCAYMGQKIHAKIIQDGMLELVNTALVEMYANCGMTAEAQDVFDEIPFQDEVSWSILMAGYGQAGNDEIVSNLLYKLVQEGKNIDSIILTIILNSCSHSGQSDAGQLYFHCMHRCFGVLPTIQHFKCMVDLFGRTGNLERVLIIIKDMPFSADLSVWHIVLGGCQKWGDVTLGRLAFEHAIQLNEKDAISYRCMSNIYAAAGMQQDAEKIEAMRVQKGAWKTSAPIGGSISQDMMEWSIFVDE